MFAPRIAEHFFSYDLVEGLELGHIPSSLYFYLIPLLFQSVLQSILMQGVL